MLSLTEKLRQIEADEFIQLLSEALLSSKENNDGFDRFVKLLSEKPCADNIVLRNLEFMYSYIIEGNYDSAEGVIQYFINRGTMYLVKEDIDWNSLIF